VGTSGHRVLVVEDEVQMRRFLKAALTTHGYRCVDVGSGEEGLRQATAYNPDLVLLDLGLPDVDGLAVLRRFREWSSAPVIVISAREQEAEKIQALDDGADDYLTKPFGTGELLARMRVALRHAERAGSDATADKPILVGDLRLDLVRRQVFARGREVHLTPIEYKLFAVLMRHAGRVLTHRYLLKEVWGPSHVEETQYLRVYMVQLRHKLEEEPSRPRYLLTEPGVGYRLRAEP
jgi:two-component system, OmpR family, KDP operon response regulator KdpE